MDGIDQIDSGVQAIATGRDQVQAGMQRAAATIVQLTTLNEQKSAEIVQLKAEIALLNGNVARLEAIIAGQNPPPPPPPDPLPGPIIDLSAVPDVWTVGDPLPRVGWPPIPEGHEAVAGLWRGATDTWIPWKDMATAAPGEWTFVADIKNKATQVVVLHAPKPITVQAATSSPSPGEWLDRTKLNKTTQAQLNRSVTNTWIDAGKASGVTLINPGDYTIRNTAITGRLDADTGGGHSIFVGAPGKDVSATIEHVWGDAPGLDTKVVGQRHNVYCTLDSTVAIRDSVFSRAEKGLGIKIRGSKAVTVEDVVVAGGGGWAINVGGNNDSEIARHVTLRRVLIIGQSHRALAVRLEHVDDVVLEDVWCVQPPPNADHAVQVNRLVRSVRGMVNLVGWNSSNSSPVKLGSHPVQVKTYSASVDVLAKLGGVAGIVGMGPVEALRRVKQLAGAA